LDCLVEPAATAAGSNSGNRWRWCSVNARWQLQLLLQQTAGAAVDAAEANKWLQQCAASQLAHHPAALFCMVADAAANS
jgi:hypothetical protein